MQGLILSSLCGFLLICSCHGEDKGDALHSQISDISDTDGSAAKHASAKHELHSASQINEQTSDVFSDIFDRTFSKRSAFWVPEVVGKRGGNFIEKRSIQNSIEHSDGLADGKQSKRAIPMFVGKRLSSFEDDRYDEADDNSFDDVMDKRLPKFVGKRLPKFVGKRLPKFVGKRVPKFVGKRLPKFVGKRVPKFVGKRLPKFVGKRIPQFVGKRIPQFVGKRIPQFVGKRIPQFVGKRIPQFVGKRIPQFVGKRIPQFVGKRIPQFVGKRDPQDMIDQDEYNYDQESLRQRRSVDKRAWGHVIPWRDMATLFNNRRAHIENIRNFGKRFMAPHFIGKRGYGGEDLWLDALRQLEEIRSKPKRFKPPLFLGKRSSNEYYLDDEDYETDFRKKRSAAESEETQTDA